MLVLRVPEFNPRQVRARRDGDSFFRSAAEPDYARGREPGYEKSGNNMEAVLKRVRASQTDDSCRRGCKAGNLRYQ